MRNQGTGPSEWKRNGAPARRVLATVETGVVSSRNGLGPTDV
jgi:hypothetical protein